MNMTQDKNWRVDKHINISVVIVVLVQFAGFVWWASEMDTRMDSQNLRLSRLERIAESASLTSERIARIEVLQQVLADSVRRMEGKLDKMGGEK